MKFPKIENHNLLLDIFETADGIPGICGQLNFKDTREVYYHSAKSNTNLEDDQKIYSIKFIPGYLYADYDNGALYNLDVIRCIQEKGYAINLKGVPSAEDYLKRQLRSYGKTVKRSVNRLETCFNITYSMFYGHIDKRYYDDLMETLFQMIIARFKQRDETSASIKDWELRCKNAYPMILEKKASLFVIHNGHEPISISLNYNFNKIHFSYIASYDIDYSKFGMGHIDIYKQLEWCITNNYSIFEMGWGTLDYKSRWSNLIYNFEHHLVVSKKSPPTGILLPLMELKIRLKSYLIAKNIHVYLKKIKDKLKLKKQLLPETLYSLGTTYEIKDFTDTAQIDYRAKEFNFLRKSVYDFLYSNSLHERNIKVYKFLNKESYIIKGPDLCQKIDLNSKTSHS